MKLDAGRARMFESYNKPAPGVFLDEIVDGLAALEDVTIQSLFTGGSSGNFRSKHLSEWLQKLEKIQPASVHVYTLDRGCPSDAIKKLEKSELELIKIKGEKRGVAVSIF